jgi:DNA-binding NarL/FixJ family response regulator
MLKKTLIIGLTCGILMLAFSFGSQWFLFSHNYWEFVLVGLAILFAAAGGAYVRFMLQYRSNTQPNTPPLVEKQGDLIEQAGISEREKEVLKELLQGKSNKEIADDLCISESTVKTHVSRLLEKFDAKSRVQIIHKLGPISI